tara:strand:- start:1865 stop:2521 length:657 start_codon:yes stop_codon:yes gene_type:complete
MKIPQTWTFSEKEVANNFESHVREQLPWYELCTKAIVHIARHYIPNEGLVYDLGASTGNIGNSLKEIMKDRNCKLVAIEKEKSMIENYNCDYGDIYQQDIKQYSYKNYDVAVCFLTLMFIEPKYRSDLLDTLYEKLNTGGALIIFDKLESEQGYFGLINYRLTLAEKTKTVKSYKDIIDKELSLQGIQRPISKKLLKKYKPKLFFKFSDFVGYVIEKQ